MYMNISYQIEQHRAHYICITLSSLSASGIQPAHSEKKWIMYLLLAFVSHSPLLSVWRLVAWCALSMTAWKTNAWTNALHIHIVLVVLLVIRRFAGTAQIMHKKDTRLNFISHWNGKAMETCDSQRYEKVVAIRRLWQWLMLRLIFFFAATARHRFLCSSSLFFVPLTAHDNSLKKNNQVY